MDAALRMLAGRLYGTLSLWMDRTTKIVGGLGVLTPLKDSKNYPSCLIGSRHYPMILGVCVS